MLEKYSYNRQEIIVCIMTTLNKGEFLITFDELQQLELADISACIDKYSALKICEKSSAPPSKIYNIWLKKLFKAYNLHDFTSNDWRAIIEYFGNVLQQLIKNLKVSNDDSYNDIEQWWLDSQELLKWLQTNINTLDLTILSLILIYVLEIIIKTCKFVNKKNLKVLCGIQQLVLTIINDFLCKIPIKNYNDLRNTSKVISSLCDVGILISSADIKTSIETWRAVAKLGESFYNSYKNISLTKTEIAESTEIHWNEKAILGIFKEIKKIILLYDMDHCSSNDNLLQIAQFYLKLLRVIINYSKDITKKSPDLKELIELYTLCQHEIANKDDPKMKLYINKPLYDIFSFIHNENNIEEVLMDHLKYDVNNFRICNLVFDYLKISIERCCKNNVKPDVNILLKVYNFLVEGSLIFIDKDKYNQILKYFVVFIILDSSNQIHKQFCEYIMDTSWIRAYTSVEILNIYYSYIFNQEEESDGIFKCLQFWTIMWNKLNKSNETYLQNKKLIEILLKTILNNIPNSKLPQYNNNDFENFEIISLMCDKHTDQILQNLYSNLNKNLTKMQECCINIESYKELLNLLEIFILRPQLVDNFFKENLLTTFTGLLTLSGLDMQRFREFINKCFRFFGLQQHQQQGEKLLQYLMEHEQQCCKIQSVYLIEFLLKERPLSTNLLQKLKTHNKLTTRITNLIDCKPLNNQAIDLKIFKDLPQTFLQPKNENGDIVQIMKKPRIDTGNFSNIKFILKDLNTNTQKLLNYPHSSFDSEDFEIIRKIKNNCEKILTN